MGEDGAVARYDFCTADADVYLQSVYSIEEKQKEKYEKSFIQVGKKEILSFGQGKGACTSLSARFL